MSEQNPAATLDQQLFHAARNGDAVALAGLLDAHPDKLEVREEPYGWTMLHAAAHTGHLAAVDLLLRRGLDVNIRENGDNTYAMHWAAAAGHIHVVRRLADEGGDVIGHGDDHELEVIGWTTCWDEADDDAHRAVAAFLLERGARHHIFSAIAMNLADEVRLIVDADPTALYKPMSRNENHQLPLHFAARMNRTEMVGLLLDLGADPSRAAGTGVTPLHLAAWHGRTKIIEILLDAGADPDARDSEHDSDPLGWAEYAGQLEAANILRPRTKGSG